MNGATIKDAVAYRIHRKSGGEYGVSANPLASLAEHKNDIAVYLRFLTNNLRIITSTGDSDKAHNDLIPHIFMQLRLTTIPLFQQTVLKWQREYMESSLKLTPSKLVTLADEESQVLKHSNQWVETIDPSVIAMQAMLTSTMSSTTTLFETLSLKCQFI